MAQDPIKRVDPYPNPAPGTSPSGGGAGGSSGPSFRSFMDDGAPLSKTQVSSSQGISPMELSADQRGVLGTPTLDSLSSQVNGANLSLDGIRNSLNDPNLKLKKSQQYLVRNKLEDATNHLESATLKLGGSVPNRTEVSPGASATERFLAYVSDGEQQMKSAQNQLANLGKNPGEVNAADYLLIQVKLSQAQQELNYTSILLSNAISGFRQFTQMQI